MAGYSGTPLLKKLGIREESRVALFNAPDRLPEELRGLAQDRLRRDLDVALLFADSLAVYRKGLAEQQTRIKHDGAIWVAWPKKSSGVETDLTENAIRDIALRTPLVDVKVCAIDETWSGLKLVVRKEHRAAFGARSK